MRSLTAQHASVVREDWTFLKPQAARLVDVLYEELFSAEPQLRILFEGPMDEQHIKLADAITYVIEHLDDPAGLVRELHELGRRHRDYGVKPHHFEAMERAFDRALTRLLGARYDARSQEAWTEFVRLVTRTMQEIP